MPELIASFREKTFWSQQNQRTNIWFCGMNNTTKDDKIKVLFNFEPYFVFHNSVPLVRAFAEAFDFSDSPEDLLILDSYLFAADILLMKEGLVKQYKTEAPNYGEMRLRVVRT